MGNFEYNLYKNKTKILLGAAGLTVLVIMIVLIAVNLRGKGKDTDENIGTGEVITPAPITLSVGSNEGEISSIEENDEAVKVCMRAKVFKEGGGFELYETGVNRSTGIHSIYENGKLTEYISTNSYNLSGQLMTLDDFLTTTNIEMLPESSIPGAYEIDKYTAVGVVKYLIADGATEIMEVATSDYIDVYLSKKDGTMYRVLITDGLMFYTKGKEIIVPNVENYLGRK